MGYYVLPATDGVIDDPGSESHANDQEYVRSKPVFNKAKDKALVHCNTEYWDEELKEMVGGTCSTFEAAPGKVYYATAEDFWAAVVRADWRDT